MRQYLKGQKVESFDTFYVCSLLKTVPAQTFIRQVMLKTCLAYAEFLQNELKPNKIFYSQLEPELILLSLLNS